MFVFPLSEADNDDDDEFVLHPCAIPSSPTPHTVLKLTYSSWNLFSLSTFQVVYNTTAIWELIYECCGGDRDSLLLIITVEDDVRCCLSMFRINFSWTKTAAVFVVDRTPEDS